jgi:hypothetical protein
VNAPAPEPAPGSGSGSDSGASTRSAAEVRRYCAGFPIEMPTAWTFATSNGPPAP